MPWNGVGPQSPSYNGSEDSGSPRRSSSKDRKVMSLKMCFISRNLTMPDLENRSDFNINIVLCCCDGIKKCGWSVCVCFLTKSWFWRCKISPDTSQYILSLFIFRLLELHSPDGQHTVVLRCKDAPTANSWFTAIHTNIAALLLQTLAHINAYLGASASVSPQPHLKHIGWLAEQVVK